MQVQQNLWRGKGLPHGSSMAEEEVSQHADAARALYAMCPHRHRTPLSNASSLAASLGIGGLWIKDERSRMGLGSFKALGAAYAIAKAADAKVRAGHAQDHASALAGTVFICASAGNHGLSLAAGAPLFGARAAVVIAETVPEAFADRLRAKGADVIRAGRAYEDGMAEAQRLADVNGWQLLPDSTWTDMTRPGRDVMEGYLIMGEEAAAQMPTPPTHVFLQAGVGGLAAACAVSARQAWGDEPKIIVVEPEAAPALWASIKAGQLAVGDGPVSNMGRLDCKEPSHLALKYLAREADAYSLVSDEEAEETVTWLAGHGLRTTPSGAAGVAALRHADSARDGFGLGLGPSSQVLCYLSEGPEDG